MNHFGWVSLTRNSLKSHLPSNVQSLYKDLWPPRFSLDETTKPSRPRIASWVAIHTQLQSTFNRPNLFNHFTHAIIAAIIQFVISKSFKLKPNIPTPHFLSQFSVIKDFNIVTSLGPLESWAYKWALLPPIKAC